MLKCAPLQLVPTNRNPTYSVRHQTKVRRAYKKHCAIISVMKSCDSRPNHISPAELQMLQRVFDNACDRKDLRKAGRDAEDLAAAIVGLYENGLREELQLVARLV